MARYLERAESTARLLDACFQPGMPFYGNIAQLYALPLHIQDVYQDFIRQKGDNELNINTVSKFLISGNSPSTIKGCLELARENARSERSRLSSEVWESINQTWIEFQEFQHKPSRLFTEWVKQRGVLFQGTVQITMPKMLSLHFIKLGIFLERANQTLRVLEADITLKTLSSNSQSDYYHRQMLLRSVSSLEAFKEIFNAAPTEEKVLELLLFHDAVPRSVRCSIERISSLLKTIGSVNKISAQKICAQILLKLRYDKLQDIVVSGQDKYIKLIQDELLSLGSAIQEGYFVIS
jgi:uncharacterized alpha-E superfamily protein